MALLNLGKRKQTAKIAKEHRHEEGHEGKPHEGQGYESHEGKR